MVLQHQITLLAFLACVGMSLQTLTCPPGQTLFEERCYMTYRPSPKCTEDFSQPAANEFCVNNGGVLASIHSQEQQDFITALIKKDQRDAAKRAKCSSCPNSQKDILYWIGLQVSHSPNGSVDGSSWTDGSAVNYGNPLSASFRPPFVVGRPTGSADDGRDPHEVCPDGDETTCVQIYGYGATLGKWTDKKCDNSHVQNVTCSCEGEQNNGNSSAVSHKHRHRHHASSSSEEEEERVDECRDEAALNGFICQYCPAGWTMFQGNCYIALPGAGGPAAQNAKCAAQAPGVTAASVHSTPENVFIAGLLNDAGVTGTGYVPLILTHPNNLFNTPPNSAAWTDLSPVNYANPTNGVQGVYPWAPAGEFPAQPDNRPPPADCVIMWLAGSGQPFGTWDDIECGTLTAAGVVCKL